MQHWFGVGSTLVDELYLLADFKLHHFEVRVGADKQEYSTTTTDLALGWRFFIWKGLHIAPCSAIDHRCGLLKTT